MPGRGDEHVAQSIVQEVKAQRLIEPERLQGLRNRLAAGEMTVQDWVALATRTAEHKETRWELEKEGEKREENWE